MGALAWWAESERGPGCEGPAACRGRAGAEGTGATLAVKVVRVRRPPRPAPPRPCRAPVAPPPRLHSHLSLLLPRSFLPLPASHRPSDAGGPISGRLPPLQARSRPPPTADPLPVSLSSPDAFPTTILTRARPESRSRGVRRSAGLGWRAVVSGSSPARPGSALPEAHLEFLSVRRTLCSR